MQYLGATSKMTEWSLFISKASHSTSQKFKTLPQPLMLKEAEVDWSYEDLEDLLELTPKKDVLFITGDWIAKVGSQEISGVIGKFDLGEQNEAGQRLTEFCQENSLVIADTLFQQHRRRLYTWTSSNGQYRNQTDYILCSKDGEAAYRQQKNKTWSWLWFRPSASHSKIQA